MHTYKNEKTGAIITVPSYITINGGDWRLVKGKTK